MSRALSRLSEVQEKVEALHQEQVRRKGGEGEEREQWGEGGMVNDVSPPPRSGFCSSAR